MFNDNCKTGPVLECLKSRCSSGVERFLGKEEVTGSNPVIGSIRMNEDGLES